MLHGGTLVSYISNEGGVAICMERLAVSYTHLTLPTNREV